ncbi:MAG: serine hydrolase, partial [Phycisphaerales bacterium]
AYKVAAGGLVATPRDLARFGAAHFDDAWLGEAMFAEVFTSQTDGAGEETGCGLGWRIASDGPGRLIYHHGGSQQGCRAALVVFPAQRVSVALMGNLGGVPRGAERVAMEVASAWLPASFPESGGD